MNSTQSPTNEIRPPSHSRAKFRWRKIASIVHTSIQLDRAGRRAIGAQCGRALILAISKQPCAEIEQRAPQRPCDQAAQRQRSLTRPNQPFALGSGQVIAVLLTYISGLQLNIAPHGLASLT